MLDNLTTWSDLLRDLIVVSPRITLASLLKILAIWHNVKDRKRASVRLHITIDSAEKPPFILREPQDERRSG